MALQRLSFISDNYTNPARGNDTYTLNVLPFYSFFFIDQFLIKMIAEIKVKGNFSVVKEAHHNYFCFSSFRFNFHRSSLIKKMYNCTVLQIDFSSFTHIHITQSHQRTVDLV